MLVIFVVLLAGAATGAAISIRAFAGTKVSTDLAQVDVVVSPHVHGSIELVVPVVDWGIRSQLDGLPLRFVATVARVDRSRARTALGPSPSAPRRTLKDLRSDGATVAKVVVERTIWVGVAGALIGGLLTGALIGALLHRRRLLLVGLIAGLIVPLAFVPQSISSWHELRDGAFDDPSFVGHGTEFARVVAFAEQLLYVGDDYSTLYRRALNSITDIQEFAARQSKDEADTSVLVASDLHDNAFVLDAFDDHADKRTVFMPGDFGQIGAKVEDRLAPRIAHLGGRVIAVSGNHDSRPFMQALAAEGATVLTRDGVLEPDGEIDHDRIIITVDGLTVAGYDDPLEADSNNAGHVLRVYGKKYDRQATAFIKWFDSLPSRPDVIMIHQNGLAQRLLKHLDAIGDTKHLIIMAGHDHKSHVDEDGPHLLVDGGTLGAGGPFAAGQQPVGFAELQLNDGTPKSVDLVTIDPISGESASRRIAVSRSHHRRTTPSSQSER